MPGDCPAHRLWPVQCPSAPAQTPSASPLEFTTIDLKPHPDQGTGQKPPIFSFSFGVKDGELKASGVTLEMLMGVAYRAQNPQLLGTPEWFNTEKYDILARADQAGLAQLAKLSPDEQMAASQGMLQRLLATQFKLALHQESIFRFMSFSSPKVVRSSRKPQTSDPCTWVEAS